MSLTPVPAWPMAGQLALLERSPVPMGWVDAQGRILHANAAARTWCCEAAPAAPQELSPLAACFRQPQRWQACLHEALEQDAPVAVVLEVLQPQGAGQAAVPLQFHLHRVRGPGHDGSGDGDGAWSVFFVAQALPDTTLASRQLRAASQYARSLLEASLDPMVTINVNGKIMDVNRATEVATGLARNALVGADFSNFFTEPDKARTGYQRVFSLGQVNDYPLALRHASGSVTEVLYNASVYHDSEGRVAGVFAAARDITQLKRSREALEATNRDVTLLAQMNNLLQSCTSVEEAVPIAASALKLLLDGVSGRLYLLRADTRQMAEAVAWGQMPPSGGDIDVGDCWALRRGRAHDVGFEVTSLNPNCHRLGQQSQPYLCLPLQAQGTVLGIVHLLFAAAAPDEDGQERRRQLAVSAADSIGLALANLRLRESLHALSIHDPLTGLYNRRFMQEALSRELARMARVQKMLAVAMLDLDHFKAFNDTYGHQAGDAVLKALARQLMGFRQGCDVSCRFGGEEFVLVLSEIERAQALTRLERLCQELAQQVVEYNGQRLPPVTLSVGVAMFPADGRDADALIKAADDALYRAKAHGRNRVECASPGPGAVVA